MLDEAIKCLPLDHHHHTLLGEQDIKGKIRFGEYEHDITSGYFCDGQFTFFTDDERTYDLFYLYEVRKGKIKKTYRRSELQKNIHKIWLDSITTNQKIHIYCNDLLYMTIRPISKNLKITVRRFGNFIQANIKKSEKDKFHYVRDGRKVITEDWQSWWWNDFSFTVGKAGIKSLHDKVENQKGNT